MKKAFVELCNNVSMTVLLGLGFISQAANFVRGVITEETGVTVVTPNVSFIPFFIFGHFWQQSYANMKILCNFCLYFARQDGQDGKNRKNISQLK